jgi:hypothetical protein
MEYVLKPEADRNYEQYLKKRYNSKRAKSFSEQRKTKTTKKSKILR